MADRTTPHAPTNDPAGDGPGAAPSLPPVPEPDRIGHWRRPPIDRSLELANLAPSLTALDASLEAAHDAACRVFQRWLDGFAGQACPLLADNEKLARLVMDRAESFGLGLYIDYRDELVRVRIAASAGPNSKRSAPDAPSTIAGAFEIVPVREPGGEAPRINGKLTARSTFPRLVVARSSDHARRLTQSAVTDPSAPRADDTPEPATPDLAGWQPPTGR